MLFFTVHIKKSAVFLFLVYFTLNVCHMFRYDQRKLTKFEVGQCIHSALTFHLEYM